jgi:hypothetical protein
MNTTTAKLLAHLLIDAPPAGSGKVGSTSILNA